MDERDYLKQYMFKNSYIDMLELYNNSNKVAILIDIIIALVFILTSIVTTITTLIPLRRATYMNVVESIRSVE